MWEIVEPTRTDSPHLECSSTTSTEVIDCTPSQAAEQESEVEMQGLRWQPLPRVHSTSLSYEQFLLDFALPQIPFILNGADQEWPARHLWPDLEYFIGLPCVNRTFRVLFATHRTPFEAQPRESSTSVGEALQELSGRLASQRPEVPPEQPRYLAGWAYHYPGGSAGLDRDIQPLPSLFDRSPSELADAAVLRWPGRNMKWLFIGERGSATRTHFDVMNSAAWLWCARGCKEWRCVHGGDRHLVPRADLNSGNLPDLFEPDLVRHPWLRRARLYHGWQRAGDVLYTPSSVLHAVRNLDFTISLTHNFVDASNLCDAARDALAQLSRGGGSPLRALHGFRELAAICGPRGRAAALSAASRPGDDAASISRLLEAHWESEGLDSMAVEAAERASALESMLLPAPGRPSVCAECWATGVAGRRGAVEDAAWHFCNACWQRWEGGS